MYLAMGITGKVGGATARHLLKQGKQVRALVRNREKAAKWADQGVELVDGDWNDASAIAAALKGVEGAFVMLPAVWAPSPDFREAKGVIANYVEALTRVVPPRVVALSSTGAHRTSGVGMITGLSLLEQGLRSLTSPVAFVRAGGFFENFLFGLQAAQGGTLPVFYNPTNRKSMMVASDDIGAEEMQTKSQNYSPIQCESRFGTIPSDELLHREFIVSPRTRRTQAVQHGGLRLIEIRQPQYDLAVGRFSVPLAHIGGLHTAGMHKLKQSSALSLDSESASAISHMPASGYNSAHDQRTLGPDRNHDSIPYRGQDAR